MTKPRKRRTWRMIALKNLLEAVVERLLENLEAKEEDKKSLEDITEEFRTEYRSGGYLPEDFPGLLFGPQLTDLRKLPPNVLMTRKILVPSEIVNSENFDVASFNRKLIHAGQDQDFLNAIGEVLEFVGVPTGLEEHSSKLGKLAHSPEPNARLFYTKVMAGEHLAAMRHLQKNGAPDSLGMDEALAIVLMQTLLFTARDVQVNAAILSNTMRQPIAGLLAKVAGYIRLDGIETIFRPVSETSAKAQELYLGREGRAEERRERLAARRPGNPLRPAKETKLTTSVGKLASHWLKQKFSKISPRQAVRARQALDEAIPTLKTENGRFLGLPETVLGITIDGKRTPFNTSLRMAVALHYSGLNPVECLSASVWRFMQSAVHLTGTFEVMTSHYRETGKFKFDPIKRLPKFELSRLPKGTKTRVRLLVDHLRRTIVKDAAFGSRSKRKEAILSFDRQADNEITKIATWLEFMGPRRRNDEKGNWDCERKTYRLLDVLPEVRLTHAPSR